MVLKILAKHFLAALEDFVKTTKTEYDNLALGIIKDILREYKILD